ncbi:MAG: mechanosensitive ion channel family protein [Clostridiales bacterium]|nr:mechanosensitive ion channel family protein [Clostridiales bacterium]
MSDLLDINNPLTMKIIYSAITVIVTFFIYKYLLKFLHNRIDDVQRYYKTKKGITYGYTVILMIVTFIIWSEGMPSLSTYFGLLSAGIAIALKDLIANIAAFLFIVLRKPFIVGDRIEISGISGDVIDQRLFQFTLMEIGNWVHADQSTGRIIHIPNSKIFTDPMANYTKGFSHIWNEIEVLITFESDWKKAKDIMNRIAAVHASYLSKDAEKNLKEASRKFMIFYNNLTPIVYLDVKSDGVLLSLRYLIDPRHRRSTSEKLWEEILDSFSREPSIELAYKTMRVVK